MDIVSQIFGGISNFFSAFFNSGFFLFIKVILAVYCTVLFVDIVLLFILRGFQADMRRIMTGANVIAASPGKIRKKWNSIRTRLDTNNQSQYKAAILEADKLADDILAGIGYQGDNMGERLNGVTSAQIDNVEDLLRAHETRNRIIYEVNFTLDRKDAEEVVKIYEDFLVAMELL